MAESDADPEVWLRRVEVASRWGVDPTSVKRMAERMGVRTKQLPGETRYHAEDIERAYREMLGEDT